MEIEIIKNNGIKIAVAKSDGIIINKTQDALDLMSEARENGASKIIIHENQIIPEFFDLKTGIAGEILQKFVTYEIQLTIIGDFSKFTGKSLRDFIYECNKQKQINFVGTMEEANKRLAA